MILYGILALSVLVFVHELGHFLLAKWNGVGVLEFAVGFGKKIFRKRIGETTYAIGLIPLGGYVRMVGDDPRALDPSFSPEVQDGKGATDLLEGRSVDEPLSDEEKALLNDRSKWFLTKGYWAKTSIVLAGPVFNLLFAILLSFSLHLVYGRPDPLSIGEKPIIGEVVPGYPADKAGIKPLDFVYSIDGVVLSSWVDLSGTIAKSGGKELTLLVDRKDALGNLLPRFEVKVSGTFDNSDLTALDDVPPEARRAMIGISPHFHRVSVSVWEAAKIAPQHVWYISKMTLKGLYAMVSGKVSSKSIAGPVYIFGEAARTAEQGMDSLITFMILLSVSLAIFNLLPVPVLDGGHLLFFTIAALKGGPVNLKAQQYATQLGMALLLALMIFAVSNDFLRHFPGGILGFFQ